jgi:hypothetical protein
MTTWTKRRMMRKLTKNSERLRLLNCEVSPKTYEDIAGLAEANGMCYGEVVEKLVARYMRRKGVQREQVRGDSIG